jgi:hypothetical protein
MTSFRRQIGSSSGGSFSTFIFISLAAWAIWHFDLSLLESRQQLFIFENSCNSNRDSTCIEKWSPSAVITYKLFIEQQNVVMHVRKYGDDRALNEFPNVYRYKNCALYNEDNWSCTAEYTTTSFVNGQSDFESDDTFKIVGKTEFYLSRFLDWL